MACNDVSPAEPDGELRLARAQRGAGGYGPIAADPDGLPFLIPAGFKLRQLSKAGDQMKGTGVGTVPNALDGMGAFPMSNGDIRLIRNHEMRDGPAQSVPIGTKPWDALAGGGCTSLQVTVDPQTGEPTLVDEFVSTSGTCVNCAGGSTPWGSWLTCEETIEGTSSGRLKDHGYVFEIPASASSEIDAVSLNAMGRFAHEALAVDPVYGHVYQTEDAGNTSGFYRFIPNVLGDLKQGGKLQMLALDGKPNFNASASGTGTPTGVPLPASWVDIATPDSVSPTCYSQGAALGGMRFSRLEGCWWGDNSAYFVATSGGAVGAGQVWQYRPITANAGRLVLVFESPSATVLDAPDNICVSPRGGLVLCEDGGGTQFLRGLTKQGMIFDFVRAANPTNATEFAGACFSPDGKLLFFNTQGSTNRNGTERGGTFVIWGPWAAGAL
ncbi:MAG: DUF839 domain-containing protein [Phycisphaerae bacterium]|nr:DUF839 domain-containing protein [Gemmatimonadaceae bacterium]